MERGPVVLIVFLWNFLVEIVFWVPKNLLNRIYDFLPIEDNFYI
jgi:hypothetical protein